MADKSWMLNPKAIRQAKECIAIVKNISGTKLKLSQPDFIQLLHEHVESSGSRDLSEAYSRLIAMAGVGFVINSLEPATEVVSQDTPMLKVSGDNMSSSAATVEYSGKMYPKYRSGLEFKGVFRGQPMYS